MDNQITPKKRTQISFEVTEQQRKDFKIAALEKNMSMNLWILRALYKAIKEESKND